MHLTSFPFSVFQMWQLWRYVGVDVAMAEGSTLGPDIDVPEFGAVCESDGEDEELQYKYGHLSIRKQTSYR